MTVYNGSSPSGLYAQLKLELTLARQESENNLSVINYKMYLESVGGGYPFSSQGYPLTLSVDGVQKVNTTSSYKVPANGIYQLSAGFFNVNHDSDGKKTFNFSGSFGTHRGTATVSGSYTLPDLAKGATIRISNTSGLDINSSEIGETIRLNFSEISSGYSYEVGFLIIDNNGTTKRVSIPASISSYYNYSIPTSWLNNYLANSSSKMVDFYIITKSGSRTLFENRDSIRVYVPDSYSPKILGVKITDKNTHIADIIGDSLYQNISSVSLQVDAVAQFGATIENYHATIGNRSLNKDQNNLIFGLIDKSGDLPYYISVTDSRGKTGNYSGTVRIESYTLPIISHFNATRRSDSTMADSKVIATHQSMGDPDMNPALIEIHYRTSPSDTWNLLYSATSNASTFDQEIYLGDNFDNFTAYEIRAKISDNFNSNSVYKTLPVSALALTLDRNLNNVGVGRLPRANMGMNGLDVEGKIHCGDYVFGKKTLANQEFLKLTNLNTIYENGVYNCVNCTGLPSESGDSGTLYVSSSFYSNDPYVKRNKIQTYIDNKNHIFVRNCMSSDVWGSWVNVNGNAQGRVKDYFKYSNGFTIRYEGGYMEQVVTYRLSESEKNFTTGSSGFYGAKTILVNFNDNFLGTPTGVSSVSNSGFVMSNVGSINNGQAHIRLYSPNQATSTALGESIITVFLKGNWK